MGEVMFCLKSTDKEYSLAIRNGEVVLGRRDLSDPYQLWRLDETFGGEAVKDEEGCSSFAIVNKATGEAIKATGKNQQVELIPFDPDNPDESLLWTRKSGETFTIRSVNDINLNLDAYSASSEEYKEGVKIFCYESTWNENQIWELPDF